LVTTPTIEYVIHYFESSPWAEQWNSGGPKRPFWLLRDAAKSVFGIVPEPGIFAVCLFKSEMDAEEFKHSRWIPDEMPADEWECVWPANPDDAVAYLEAMSSQVISHAVINVPPGGTQRPLITPIEVIIDHVASRGISRISIPLRFVLKAESRSTHCPQSCLAYRGRRGAQRAQKSGLS
jgi:hypothetical protein